MNKSAEPRSEFEDKSSHSSLSLNLNKKPVQGILKDINQEDRKVALAVESEIDSIAQAVKVFIQSWKKGGRIYFVGAGTSGRIGVIEACELPATFGFSPERVQFLLAGGKEALTSSCEEAEDDEDLGKAQVEKKRITGKDLMIGISASGKTPFTLECVKGANAKGAQTIGIINSSQSPLERIVNIPIVVEVGPEFLRGSTRMKAGTAQKMVLNMLTTTAMIKLGHTCGNLMIDVKASNRKLEKRTEDILQTLTGEKPEIIHNTLKQANYEARPALLMIKRNCTYLEAKKILEEKVDK